MSILLTYATWQHNANTSQTSGFKFLIKLVLVEWMIVIVCPVNYSDTKYQIARVKGTQSL